MSVHASAFVHESSYVDDGVTIGAGRGSSWYTATEVEANLSPAVVISEAMPLDRITIFSPSSTG